MWLKIIWGVLPFNVLLNVHRQVGLSRRGSFQEWVVRWGSM